jgi:hypothetical protein
MTKNLSHIGPCPKSSSLCPELINCLAEGLVNIGYYVVITCLKCHRVTYELMLRRVDGTLGYRMAENPPKCYSKNETRASSTHFMCEQCRGAPP